MTETTDLSTAAISLPEFLGTAKVGELSSRDQLLIVEQALLVLEQTYALLPFKVARYGINPLQRLRLMQTRLGRQGEPEPAWRFHAELVDIFNSLRDLHTRYTLPEPFHRTATYLPFLLKEFTEDGRLRYLVGRRRAEDPEPSEEAFRFDVEVTHWNGVPIARAIDRFAAQMPGANPEARHIRAVDWFTLRALRFAPPPDEEWVDITYIDQQHQVRDIRRRWRVGFIEPAPAASTTAAAAEAPVGFDVEGMDVARLRTRLFAPEFLAAEESGQPVETGPGCIDVAAEMSTLFEACRLGMPGREVGYLRIRGFRRSDVPATGIWIQDFVNEFIRLLGELPPDGLVLDIRGNLGGAILAAELCLQALTARPVQPEPAEFAATMLNLQICRSDQQQFGDWLPSMEQAVESGALHSAALPLTPPDLLRRVPQSYFSPVVLITDARCYSAADMFAAGFQDNGIGKVLGIHGNTGAGGGNVWDMRRLSTELISAGIPFGHLPGGAGLSVVIRRLLRVGPKNAGVPLEDYGVVPDARHVTTRRDIMYGDADLMRAAAALLGESRRFDVELSEAGGELTASFHVLGIDRADVLVDGRPRLTADLGRNPGPVPVSDVGTPAHVQVTGYHEGVPVAARTFVRAEGTLQLRTRFE